MCVSLYRVYMHLRWRCWRRSCQIKSKWQRWCEVGGGRWGVSLFIIVTISASWLLCCKIHSSFMSKDHYVIRAWTLDTCVCLCIYYLIGVNALFTALLIIVRPFNLKCCIVITLCIVVIWKILICIRWFIYNTECLIPYVFVTVIIYINRFVVDA